MKPYDIFLRVCLIVVGLLMILWGNGCPLRIDRPNASVCSPKPNCGQCSAEEVCGGWCPSPDGAQRGCRPPRGTCPVALVTVPEGCPEDALGYLPGGAPVQDP